MEWVNVKDGLPKNEGDLVLTVSFNGTRDLQYYDKSNFSYHNIVKWMYWPI